jgi:hypothetical protein
VVAGVLTMVVEVCADIIWVVIGLFVVVTFPRNIYNILLYIKKIFQQTLCIGFNIN